MGSTRTIRRYRKLIGIKRRDMLETPEDYEKMRKDLLTKL